MPVHLEPIGYGIADDLADAIDSRNLLAARSPQRLHRAELLRQGPRHRRAHMANRQTDQYTPQLFILGCLNIGQQLLTIGIQRFARSRGVDLSAEQIFLGEVEEAGLVVKHAAMN